MKAGPLNRLLTVERPIPDTRSNGAGCGKWLPIFTVRAQVQDILPSRGESSVELGSTMFRPARVRMRYRTDITPNMRFVMPGREMHIVSGPAELGFREGLEWMVAEYIPAGNRA